MTHGAAQPAADLPSEIATMVAHHVQLQSELDKRVTALTGAVDGDGDAEAARGALSAFLADEVIPHALAEEDAIYRAGSAIDVLAALVDGMIMEHETLVGLAAAVGEGAADRVSVSAAEAFRALFRVHVRKENELLLPALLARGSDPAVLLTTMHTAFETRRREAANHRASAAAPASAAPSASDGERVVDTRIPTTKSCAELANDAVDNLTVGDSVVLVADHDPRGIRYMLQAERPGAISWELLENGPERWQARIRRTVCASAD